VEVVLQEQASVPRRVRQVLARESNGRDEPFGITFERRAPELDEGLVVLVEHQTVPGSEDAELMEQRPHLRRERERGRRLGRVDDDHPELIEHVVGAEVPKAWADEPMRGDLE
jgi:hypothetical protein